MNKASPPPAAMDIIIRLANAHELELGLMFSMSKAPHITRFRHEAWAMLRSAGYTMVRIGSWWGIRHSTVSMALMPARLEKR